MERNDRWKEEVPEENWKKWGYAYIAHMATGFIAALGMMTVPFYFDAWYLVIPFAGLTILSMTRQTIEFLRQNDTPGRDFQHIMMGYVPGLLLGVALLATVII